MFQSVCRYLTREYSYVGFLELLIVLAYRSTKFSDEDVHSCHQVEFSRPLGNSTKAWS